MTTVTDITIMSIDELMLWIYNTVRESHTEMQIESILNAADVWGYILDYAAEEIVKLFDEIAQEYGEQAVNAIAFGVVNLVVTCIFTAYCVNNMRGLDATNDRMIYEYNRIWTALNDSIRKALESGENYLNYNIQADITELEGEKQLLQTILSQVQDYLSRLEHQGDIAEGAAEKIMNKLTSFLQQFINALQNAHQSL